jgi:lipid A 4'-phosphatase
MSVVFDTRVVARKGNVFRAFNSAAVTVGLLAGALFLVFPEIDLLFSRIFYQPSAGFIGHAQPHVPALRWLFIVFYFSCIALVIAGLVRTHARRDVWLRLTSRQWLFLAVCLGVGPGLVANILLKDQWGRARPKHVVEFGGEKAFTSPLVPAWQCQRACSFVSGEASAVFVPFYAAALIVPRWSVLLVAAGTVGGLVAGLIRVSQGAHFLSDVIFAGVFMALTVLFVHRIMFSRGLNAQALQPSDRLQLPLSR